jgi:hypothetical protein
MKLNPLHLGVIAALAASCGAGAASQNPNPPRGCNMTALSLQPPDSVPQWVYDPANAVRGTWITGTYTRDVLVISFVTGTDARSRAEAVCAVAGEVIGGRRMHGAEGVYYIRIPPDSTQQRMRRAVSLLDTLPHVNLVTPEFVDNAVTTAGS